jgi:hypothetical protein
MSLGKRLDQPSQKLPQTTGKDNLEVGKFPAMIDKQTEAFL